MALIKPWQNSTPFFGAVVFCTTKIDDFKRRPEKWNLPQKWRQTQKWKRQKRGRQPQNEDYPKNDDDLKYEDVF